ncbi:MAG TPA: HAD-IA family hydrolase, partial [Acidimicrobiales bacterium]|nr:HAD-IA family hydrolase [Acidimicrobiales bacterium]
PVIDAVLDRLGLRNRFAVIATAADDLFGKPHPSIFLRTAELVGAAPERCVVIEDSINGVIAAKAARMRVVAVPPAGLRGDARYAIADVQLPTLEQIGSAEVVELLGLAPPA